ncbi:MAG: pgmB [Candidatus Saccharibacteria bacterium]|jgi:beta-phosphoglucomutase-like phosphatase (HAD superfamily)|nr:pgmB [Candidatus Saccharibacteria bacterium]
MPSPHLPAAIAYDLDGVVVSSTGVHYAAWKELFVDEIGLPAFPMEHYDKYVSGRQRSEGFIAYLIYSADELGDEKFRKIAADPEKVKHYTDQKQERVHSLISDPAVEITVFDDTVSSIKEWRARGVKTTIASASENTPLLLARVGLTDLFDALAYGKSALINGRKVPLRSKPAPDAFIKSVEQIGVAPEDCIGVEDAGKGIEAINAAGMMSIAIERTPNPDLRNAQPDLLLHNFAETSVDELVEKFAEWKTAKRPH